MNQRNLQPRWVTLTVAALLSSMTYAQGGINNTGMYVGISAGQSKNKFDNDDRANALAGVSVTANALHNDQRGNAYKVFLGTSLTPHWAVETGYFDLGRTGFDASTHPAGAVANRTQIKGVNVDFVGTLPMTNRWDLLALLGVVYAQSKSHVNGSGAAMGSTSSTSEGHMNYKFGFGTQYALTQALYFRLESERYRVRHVAGKMANVALISVGLVYRFGGPMPKDNGRGTSYATVYSMPQPTPQAPVATPASTPGSVVVKVSVAVVEQKHNPLTQVKLQSYLLFGFNQAALAVDGKRALDKLLVDLKDVTVQSIQVTGHADRLGPQAYNTELSLRRAETVRDYLVQVGGVSASQVSITGTGSTQRETRYGECRGLKTSQKLITCLRADRHVEVNVTGTQPTR